MSRTSIFALSAIAALGTTCLVPVEALAVGHFAARGSSRPVFHAAPAVRHQIATPHVFRPKSMHAHLQPNLQHVPSGPSHQLPFGSGLSGHPVQARKARLASLQTMGGPTRPAVNPNASHLLGLKTGPGMFSAFNNKLTPNPTANDVTTLTNTGQADLAKAGRDNAQAAADRASAANLRQQAQAAAKAGKFFVAAKLDQEAAKLEKTANGLQSEATKLTKAGNAEIDAANRLAAAQGNGNGQSGGQGAGSGQGSGQGTGSGNGSAVDGGSNSQIASGSQSLSTLQPSTASQQTSTQQQPTTTNSEGQQQTALPAIALGWNTQGQWVVRTGAQLEDAANDAVQSCNEQYGRCALAKAAVLPNVYGCMVVASAAENPSRLFASTSGTLNAARDALIQQLSNAGVTGELQYSGCNA